MHDLRLYRIALVPAFLALFVVAFALENRPRPHTTALSADAFDGARAFGTGPRPPRGSLRELARAFPDRRPGASGDEALAARVAEELAAQDFAVSRVRGRGDTAQGRVALETVVGVRPGLSSERVVVLAHRDAASSPALAELSATAALLELARVSRIRDLRRTLVLVSTSGGSSGGTGARQWAARQQGVDVAAVIVLGDLAGTAVRKPWVVPWSLAGRPAPLRLQRTLQASIRQEVGRSPGASRASGQWARRAVPLTVTEQGPLLAEGLPAVRLSVSGERPPAADAAVSPERLDAFGRAALRAVIALDEAPERPRPETDGIVTLGKVLPTWAVRLLVGLALAPALLVAVDGFFRVGRRRGHPARWLRWAAVGAVPFVLAYAWARLLDGVGVVTVPPAPVAPGALAPEGATAAVLASTVLVWLAAWLWLRPLLLRRGGKLGRPGAEGGGAAGASVLLCLLAAALWVATPYAAALLVPAAHLWTFGAAPGSRLRGWLTPVTALAGLALPALVTLHYASALGAGPLELAWLAFLAACGGTLAVPGALALSLFAAATIATAIVMIDRDRSGPPAGDTPPPPAPLSRHAGPGALGGVPSALRQ